MSSPLIAQLRRDLVTSSFSVETVGDLWGDEAAAALFRGQRLPALRALERRRREGVALSRAETLAALFVLNVPVDRSAVDAALPTLTSAGAAQLGLIADASAASTPPAGAESASSGGPAATPPGGAAADARPGATAPATVRALLDLRPYSFVDSFGAGSWWILSDLGEVALGRALDEDHVLGVGGASLTLSGLMINRPVDRVLDLGTGCGIQALHASRHARQVIATDISERALWLAALNAELNAIDNIEFRLGSLFEPVEGEQFDQIVSNPPFVITPRREGVPLYEYRDAGMVGDTLVATVMQGAEAHLRPGGVAQLLGNWEYRDDPLSASSADGLDRAREWLSGSGLDAWLIERELQDAPQYAETWIRDGGTREGTAEFDALYAAWLDDFAARGVTHVGFGYVLLRRPPAGGAAGAGVAGAGAPGAFVTGPRAADGGEAGGGEIGAAGDGATDGGATGGRAAGDGATGGGAAGRGAGSGDALRPARRRAPLRRFENLDGARGSNPAGLGEYFATALAGYDWQSTRSDDELLASTVVYASDVTEERHYWPGQENPTVMTLRQGTGFARTVSLDTALAALVGACDGDLAIGQICGAIAHLLEVDERALLADVLPRIRALIDDGFLLPHEG